MRIDFLWIDICVRRVDNRYSGTVIDVVVDSSAVGDTANAVREQTATAQGYIACVCVCARYVNERCL